jgi:uncharacterized membrane protein YcaP (DUF421 family)
MESPMPDWSAMFKPELSLFEVMARGTIMYLFLFIVMRFLLKREGGQVNIADILVVVAVVDGAQPAFSGDAQSITESAVFVLTILFWSWLLNWASFRFKPLAFLTAAPPMILFEDGKLNRKNMRKALLSREELFQQLREEGGVDDLGQVERIIMEGDGEMSVIKKEDAS